MQFDHPASCTIAASTPVETAPGTLKLGTLMPSGSYYYDGILLSCFFPSIPSGQIINATVGVDLPAYSSLTSVAPPPPVSPACSHDPDDHTFGVLLDTCGVPSIAVEIVTGVFLGGATAIGGAGVIGLETAS
jgi:hypothetical protein